MVLVLGFLASTPRPGAGTALDQEGLEGGDAHTAVRRPPPLLIVPWSVEVGRESQNAFGIVGHVLGDLASTPRPLAGTALCPTVRAGASGWVALVGLPVPSLLLSFNPLDLTDIDFKIAMLNGPGVTTAACRCYHTFCVYQDLEG